MSNCTSFVMVSDGDQFSMVDNNGTFSMIGGNGSGGGTTDYNKLRHKPTINGVILEGDKSSEDLGLLTEEDLAELDGRVDTLEDEMDTAQDDITSLEEAVEQLDTDIEAVDAKVDKKAPAIYSTASGDIASFSDGADGMPIKSLVANIEPVQDLHGYDYPWPGGGGKNLLPMTLANMKVINTAGTWSGNVYTYAGIAYTIITDDGGNVTGVTANGTATAYSLLRVYNEITFSADTILSGCASGGSFSGYRLQADGGTARQDVGNGVTIPANEAKTRVIIAVPVGTTVQNVLFKPMIRLATETDATFAPYSNICPISGLTGAEIYDDPAYGGKVYWNQSYCNLTHSHSAKGITAENNNGNIHIYGTSTDTGTSANLNWTGYTTVPHGHIFAVRTDLGLIGGDYICDQYNGNSRTNLLNRLAKRLDTVDYIILQLNIQEVGRQYDITGHVMVFDLTQMFGSSIADHLYNLDQASPGEGMEWFRKLFPNPYYPYNAGEETTVSAVNGDPYRQISISFPSSAGTVYGGTLDVTNGVLTVDRAMVDLGTLNWTKVASSNYKTFVGDLNIMRYVYNEKTVMSSAYVGTSGRDASASADNYVWVDSRNTIAIKDTSKADMSASEFKTAMSGVQLVYELATPITYQLTPQELDTLLGTNNIWTDVGTVDVEYPADTKLYIEQLTKPTEDDMTANTNIAANKFFMVGNTLYFSTAAIAAGATIIPGTNCNVVSLADALNNLNS